MLFRSFRKPNNSLEHREQFNAALSLKDKSSQLTGTPTKTGYTGENMNLATITVLGVSSASSVTANGGSATFTYDGTNKVLSITGLSVSLSQSFTVSWS
ncbi:unnamed protein product [Timema podura]|uniref:Uncharacterized protein n=1 Tax=Timema podura TaxID=61482 RepID=A0ABN7PME2_TIMPD|nr:unnamed protein product [Timema podura]